MSSITAGSFQPALKQRKATTRTESKEHCQFLTRRGILSKLALISAIITTASTPTATAAATSTATVAAAVATAPPTTAANTNSIVQI